MKTNVLKKSFLILAIGAIAAFSLLAWQRIQSFINKGLSDSKKIRIAEANSCVEQKEAPQFSGCNSIL